MPAEAFAVVPLVVDLDGTLCRSDTFHEALAGLAATRPGVLLRAPAHLRAGKAALKRHVAGQLVVAPESLPYDPQVLDLVAAARAAGRPVALVSAADHRQVEAVAAHLGGFDLAVGTGSAAAGPENLSGAQKARFLRDLYGARGFDYIGDSRADIPVWAAARRAFAVRPSAGLRRAAGAAGITLEAVGAAEGSGLRALVQALRPHQWAKNLLVLLPVLAAQDASALGAALLAMLCFSLTASGVYLVNDLADLPADRAHPRKRFRPFAAGRLAIAQGVAAAAAVFAAGILLALLLLPAAFSATLLVYVVATFAYSFWLKRKMMVDIIGLAGLYTLRIIGGATATGIVLSPWLLVFSMFLFFSLATIKRQSELIDAERRGAAPTPGRNLQAVDLGVLQGMAIASGQAAVLVFALYAQDDLVAARHARPELLLLVCPVLFFWLSRIQILTRRGFMTDDPLVFTMRDRVSLASGAIMVAVFVLSGVGA
jgi:4-hydroxybenzoate polyprenyltransferase/phosphoserine phosphatase